MNPAALAPLLGFEVVDQQQALVAEVELPVGDRRMRPGGLIATVGLVNYVGADVIDWGAMAAASLTLVLPVLVLTILAQRGLLRGLTAGAVKG